MRAVWFAGSHDYVYLSPQYSISLCDSLQNDSLITGFLYLNRVIYCPLDVQIPRGLYRPANGLWDQLRSNLGIIWGSGMICRPVQAFPVTFKVKKSTDQNWFLFNLNTFVLKRDVLLLLISAISTQLARLGLLWLKVIYRANLLSWDIFHTTLVSTLNRILSANIKMVLK